MKKVYLHIGQHKTGTTSIQHFCSKNSEALLSLGYQFNPNVRYHHNIAFKLLEDNLKNLEAFANVVNNSSVNNHILSSEVFCKCDSKQMKHIRRLFKKKKVDLKIIVYLRKQDKAIESIYTQLLKNDKIKVSIQEYLNTNKFERLHYGSFLDNWLEVFGRKNLSVVCFDNVKLRLMDSFLAQVGISKKDAKNKFQKINRKNSRPTRSEFQEMLNKAKIEMKILGDGDEHSTSYKLLSKEHIVQINKRFRAQNFYTARKYFDRDKLFYS